MSEFETIGYEDTMVKNKYGKTGIMVKEDNNNE